MLCHSPLPAAQQHTNSGPDRIGSWTVPPSCYKGSWTVPPPFNKGSWTVPPPFYRGSWTVPPPFYRGSWTAPPPWIRNNCWKTSCTDCHTATLNTEHYLLVALRACFQECTISILNKHETRNISTQIVYLSVSSGVKSEWQQLILNHQALSLNKNHLHPTVCLSFCV